jgi:hemerythrin
MDFIEWDDKYEIGIQPFDDHHRHLVRLTNKVFDDTTACGHAGSMERVLRELSEYTDYHFAAEEQWLKEHDYPEFEGHRGEHSEFTKYISDVCKDHALNKNELSMEVLTFLYNWLIQHILESDVAYSRFIQGKASVQ